MDGPRMQKQIIREVGGSAKPVPLECSLPPPEAVLFPREQLRCAGTRQGVARKASPQPPQRSMALGRRHLGDQGVLLYAVAKAAGLPLLLCSFSLCSFCSNGALPLRPSWPAERAQGRTGG